MGRLQFFSSPQLHYILSNTCLTPHLLGVKIHASLTWGKNAKLAIFSVYGSYRLQKKRKICLELQLQPTPALFLLVELTQFTCPTISLFKKSKNFLPGGLTTPKTEGVKFGKGRVRDRRIRKNSVKMHLNPESEKFWRNLEGRSPQIQKNLLKNPLKNEIRRILSKFTI